MNRLGKVSDIAACIEGCRADCAAKGVPFHADALAAALGIPYEQLARYAAGCETSHNVATLLSGALQECTASVVSFAMERDAKHHPLVMWYLRNRAGFADKGDAAAPSSTAAVTFVGENKI